jgi:hypothetical protein
LTCSGEESQRGLAQPLAEHALPPSEVDDVGVSGLLGDRVLDGDLREDDNQPHAGEPSDVSPAEMLGRAVRVNRARVLL